MKKAKHIFLINIFFILVSTVVFSQKGSMDLPSYHPASPNAASLGNFGLYSVNKNLGNVNINIPVYTLSEKGLRIPISLNYNTSGIRLNDLASWVGLGWTLNAGGAIIRNVKGLPDRQYYEAIPDMHNYAFNETNWGYLLEVVDGERDTAPDHYVISALGISGSFYFDRESNQAVFEDTRQVKIETKSKEEIHAVLEDGTRLIFGTGSDGSDAAEKTDSNLDDPYYTLDFVSAWYLTEVISANRQDTISFKYKMDENDTVKLEDYSVPTNESLVLGPNIPYEATGYLKANYHELSRIEKKYLDTIRFKNGYIKFESSTGRQDLEDDYKLDAIKVYSYDDIGNDKLIDQYHFVYEYFLRSGGVFSEDYEDSPISFSSDRQTNSRNKSLKLTEMYRGPSGSKHKHKFEYNTTTLPSRCTTAQDFWGYCNNNTGTLLPETFATAQAMNVVYFHLGNGDRDSDEAKMKAGVLEKIIYPTGGYTVFEHEANKYMTTEPVMRHVIQTVQAYGDECNDDPLYPGYIEKTFTIPANATNIILNKQFSPVEHQGSYTPYVFLDSMKYYRPAPDPNCNDCPVGSSPGGGGNNEFNLWNDITDGSVGGIQSRIPYNKGF